MQETNWRSKIPANCFLLLLDSSHLSLWYPPAITSLHWILIFFLIIGSGIRDLLSFISLPLSVYCSDKITRTTFRLLSRQTSIAENDRDKGNLSLSGTWISFRLLLRSHLPSWTSIRQEQQQQQNVLCNCKKAWQGRRLRLDFTSCWRPRRLGTRRCGLHCWSSHGLIDSFDSFGCKARSTEIRAACHALKYCKSLRHTVRCFGLPPSTIIFRMMPLTAAKQ